MMMHHVTKLKADPTSFYGREIYAWNIKTDLKEKAKQFIYLIYK